MVEVTGVVEWKSGVLAGSIVGNIPAVARPAAPQWCTSKPAKTGGNDAVADFLLGVNGDINIPSIAYYQGSPVVNIIYPLHFSYFVV
jgi:hypothetical protein